MSRLLQEQRRAASSMLEIDTTYNSNQFGSLEYPVSLPATFPSDQYLPPSTINDFDILGDLSEGDGNSQDVELVGSLGKSSNPINITRKRSRADIQGSMGGSSGSLSPPGYMEHHLENLQEFADQPMMEPTVKQSRSSVSMSDQLNDEPVDDMFPMEPTTPPSYSTLTNASPVKPPGNGAEGKGPKETKKQDLEDSLELSDKEMFNACLQANSRLINDNSLMNLGNLQISWVKPPAKKVRPSYNCEGSRGAIKTEDNAAVELNVNLTSGLGDYEAVIIAACIADTPGQAVTAHPHFKTSCVGDQPYVEREVDGVPSVCIKKSMAANQSKLKLDVGIKRRDSKKGERTQKLTRDCRVVFKLCLLQKETREGSEFGWSTAHWAQIVTDSIKCVQSQGPPSISEMTSRECAVSGGLVVSVKGKNLESKADDAQNLKVIFHDKECSWTAPAEVFHNVTTPNSLAFQVPPFRKLTEREKQNPGSTIPVTIEVIVDDRSSDVLTDFRYKVPKMASWNVHQSSQQAAPHMEYLGVDDVFSVLHEVERKPDPMLNGTGYAPSVNHAMTSAAMNIPSYQQHAYTSNQSLQSFLGRPVKQEPDGIIANCMQNQSWPVQNSTDQYSDVTPPVDQLTIDDSSLGPWGPNHS